MYIKQGAHVASSFIPNASDISGHHIHPDILIYLTRFIHDFCITLPPNLYLHKAHLAFQHQNLTSIINIYFLQFMLNESKGVIQRQPPSLHILLAAISISMRPARGLQGVFQGPARHPYWSISAIFTLFL